MMHAAQRHRPHHRCIRSRRTMKSQVTVAARRSGSPRDAVTPHAACVHAKCRMLHRMQLRAFRPWCRRTVPQVVEVDAGSVGSGAGLDPDAEEVVSAQGRALGADEDQALRSGLGVSLQMPAEFRYQVGGDGNGTPTGAGFGCIGLQPATVELGCRPSDPDLACVEVETVTAQRNEFAPAQARVGCQEHEHPIPARYGVSDAVDDGKRDDLPFG